MYSFLARLFEPICFHSLATGQELVGKEKEVLEIKIDVRDAVIRDLRASQARLNHKLASQAHSAGTDLPYEN